MSRKQPSTRLLQTCVQKVTDYPFKQVLFVAESYFNQIRHLPKEVKNQKLFDTLMGTAQSYGAREKVPGFVMTECCRLVLEKYSYLALKEITEAYRQKASGEIKVKGGEMYGGIFNAENLGKVLFAYNESRKKVMAAFLDQLHLQKTKVIKGNWKLFKAILFEVCFLQIMKSSEFESWEEVPEWWYLAAKKRDLIYYEVGEKKSYYDKAVKALPAYKKKEIEQGNLKALLLNQAPQDDDRIAAMIARKMVVFEKFVKGSR